MTPCFFEVFLLIDALASLALLSLCSLRPGAHRDMDTLHTITLCGVLRWCRCVNVHRGYPVATVVIGILDLYMGQQRLHWLTRTTAIPSAAIGFAVVFLDLNIHVLYVLPLMGTEAYMFGLFQFFNYAVVVYIMWESRSFSIVLGLGVLGIACNGTEPLLGVFGTCAFCLVWMGKMLEAGQYTAFSCLAVPVGLAVLSFFLYGLAGIWALNSLSLGNDVSYSL